MASGFGEGLGSVWASQGCGRPLPMVIDLDGGLFRRGPVASVLAAAARYRPWDLCRLGVAAGVSRPDILASRLAEGAAAAGDAAALGLALDRGVLDAARRQTRLGGALVAVSGAEQGMAEACLSAAGLHAEVFGSDTDMRLTAERKARVLAALFGPGGFVYLGGGRGHEGVCRTARRSAMAGLGAAALSRLHSAGVAVQATMGGAAVPVTLRLADLAASGGGGETVARRASRRLWLAGWQGDAAAPAAEARQWRRRAA